MDIHTIRKLFPSDRIINGALCYLIQDDQMLMLRRHRPPHQGYWTAPGGTTELGESPQECIIREIREETGYTLHDPALRGIVNVYDVAVPVHWLLFIFRANHATGSLTPTHEGDLAWIPLGEIKNFALPHADRLYLPYVLDSRSFFQLKLVYDTPDRCLERVFYEQ